MRFKGFTLIEAIVVVVIFAILVVITLPVSGGSRETDCRVRCPSNLKQIALGFVQYTQDYDEKFPPVAHARAGYWAGSLQPYLKSGQIFQCPADGTSAPKTTDYYYNARLASVSRDFEHLNTVILAGDGTGNSPTSYHHTRLPETWRDDAKSPAWRHAGMATYAFADGHVKAFKPAQVTLKSPSQNQPTFLVN